MDEHLEGVVKCGEVILSIKHDGNLGRCVVETHCARVCAIVSTGRGVNRHFLAIAILGLWSRKRLRNIETPTSGEKVGEPTAARRIVFWTGLA